MSLVLRQTRVWAKHSQFHPHGGSLRFLSDSFATGDVKILRKSVVLRPETGNTAGTCHRSKHSERKNIISFLGELRSTPPRSLNRIVSGTTTQKFDGNNAAPSGEKRAKKNYESAARNIAKRDLPPTFDGSPLLDPRRYSRLGRRSFSLAQIEQKQDCSLLFESASSSRISLPQITTFGTDATHRLKEGRIEAISVIRSHLVGQRNATLTSRMTKSSTHQRGGSQNDNSGLWKNSIEFYNSFVPDDARRAFASEMGSKKFFLTGHGVPKQLLQDHIDLAHDMLIKNPNASEVGFKNVDGHLGVDGMSIRNLNGDKSVASWPRRHSGMSAEEFDAWLGYEHRLELFLTVMNRIASMFGAILSLPDDQTEPKVSTLMSDIMTRKNGIKKEKFSGNSGDNFNDNDSKNMDDDENRNKREKENLEKVLSKMKRNSLRHWNVSFVRGESQLHYPHLGSDEGKMIGPLLVELSKESYGKGQSPLSSSSGHVRIAMQGLPHQKTDQEDHREKPAPVTIIFDACFFESESESKETVPRM